MLIRPERPGDEAVIRALHGAAFGGPDEGRIVDAVRGSADALPGLSLIAEVEGEIVGHCLSSRGWLDGGVPIVAFGPIGVRPDVHGRGIGSELIRATIVAAEAAGERLIVVLGHAAYYPRFGFRPARALGLEPPAPWPDPAWMALPLAGWDANRPDGRGTVHYPGAFEPL